MKTFVIAEIGINHNGDLDLAKEMIRRSKESGADAVKFQKRTVGKVYTAKELDQLRESPWGTTNRNQKEGLEFSAGEYSEIDKYCTELGIQWTASAWDTDSQKFLQQWDRSFNKVASAMLTHHELLEMIAKEGLLTFISTGMSTLEEIDKAVKIFQKHNTEFILMHCNSTYPMNNEDANLRVMTTLMERYAGLTGSEISRTIEVNMGVGYSGHEVGRIVSLAAVAMGAVAIERHVTTDRTQYGSDQASSIEFEDLERLVIDIRGVEKAMGSPKKVVYDSEVPIREKLRRIK